MSARPVEQPGTLWRRKRGGVKRERAKWGRRRLGGDETAGSLLPHRPTSPRARPTLAGPLGTPTRHPHPLGRPDPAQPCPRCAASLFPRPAATTTTATQEGAHEAPTQAAVTLDQCVHLCPPFARLALTLLLFAQLGRKVRPSSSPQPRRPFPPSTADSLAHRLSSSAMELAARRACSTCTSRASSQRCVPRSLVLRHPSPFTQDRS